MKRAQQFGVNALEMTLPRFETDGNEDYRHSTYEDFADYNSNDSYNMKDEGPNNNQNNFKTDSILETNDYSFVDPTNKGKKSKKRLQTEILEVDQFSGAKESVQEEPKLLSHSSNKVATSISVLGRPVRELDTDNFGLSKPDKSKPKTNWFTNKGFID